MRQRVVQRSRLRHSDNGSTSQRNPEDRNSQIGKRRRKAARLLCEDHPVVVVIKGRELGDITQGGAVIMRRETRAQRPKDEDQST